MQGALRAAPAAPDARSASLPLGLLLGLLGLMALSAFPARAETTGSADSDGLPAATSISKITWSRGKGSTRVEFHGSLLPLPTSERASPTALRLDFAAVDAESLPTTLDVGSPEISSIVRIPASTGALPAGISCRLLIILARTDVAHSLDGRPDELILSVADADAVGRGEELPPAESELAAPLTARRLAEQPPELAEVLERPQSIQLNVDLGLRAAPSAIAAIIGTVESGQSRVIDARRGEWAHVQSGGWLRLPQVAAATDASASTPGTSSVITRRTPAAWSVVTLGTNLTITIEEVLGSDPKAAALERLYAGPVKLARFRVAVDAATPYAFRLPSKKGRVTFALGPGKTQESLDPTSLPLANAGARSRLDLIFAAASLGAGASSETYLVFPAALDFLAVTDAHVEVNGLSHRLFRVPGSGEAAEP